MRSLLSALVLPLCLGAVITPPSSLDFTFYDASGTEYRSSRLAEQIAKRFPGVSESLLLVVCASASQSTNQEQAGALQGFDFESHQLLWVSTCAPRDGYHTRSPDTEALVSAWGPFSVFLLSGTGRVLLHSSKPISAESLARALAPPAA